VYKKLLRAEDHSILHECSWCKKKKEWGEFYLRTKPSKRTGQRLRYSQCKECHRERRRDDYPRIRKREVDWRLRYKYGIDLGEYKKMLKAQGGTCMICNEKGHIRKKDSRKGKGGTRVPLSVDHNHKTGKIRGLLCLNCNTGIGHFKDDVDVMKKAIKYLEK